MVTLRGCIQMLICPGYRPDCSLFPLCSHPLKSDPRSDTRPALLLALPLCRLNSTTVRDTPFRSLIWPGTHAERSDPQEAPEPSRSLVLRLRPGPERYRIPVHTDFTEEPCFRENRNRFK